MGSTISAHISYFSETVFESQRPLGVSWATGRHVEAPEEASGQLRVEDNHLHLRRLLLLSAKNRHRFLELFLFIFFAATLGLFSENFIEVQQTFDFFFSNSDTLGFKDLYEKEDIWWTSGEISRNLETNPYLLYTFRTSASMREW